MTLNFDDIFADATCVAFVGLAKNAGKTTAMNAAISQSARTLGILSVGIDGESLDAISGFSKPSIFVSEGTLIATAEQCLKSGSARHEILAGTGLRSPLGELLLTRIRDAGTVLLAGIRHRKDAVVVRDLLLARGAQRVFVDGAFDRIASASPRVSQCLVLSTGMAVSASLEMVAARTAELVARLTLSAGPCPPIEFAAQQAEFVAGHWRALDEASLFAQNREIAGEGLWIPGLLSDQTLEPFIGRQIQIICQDATHVMVSAPVLRRFFRNGGSIRVRDEIRIALVTSSPFTADGRLESAELACQAIQAAVPAVPVADVRAGIFYPAAASAVEPQANAPQIPGGIS